MYQSPLIPVCLRMHFPNFDLVAQFFFRGILHMSVILKCDTVDARRELFLIEMQVRARPHKDSLFVQGIIVSKDGSTFNGKPLGKLRTNVKGNYELVIGNHVLEGSAISLSKPLVVFYPTDEVEEFDQVKDLRANVCRGHGVIRRKIIFKNRPNIVLGALGDDFDMTQAEDRETRGS